MKRNLFLIGVLMVLALLLLAACQQEQPQPTENVPAVTQAPCPTAAPCPEAPEAPEGAAVEVPFLEAWQSSAHADAEAEAFVHWNEDDPAEVPPSCATCHSTPGYQDFLGVDGSAFGVVDQPAEVGTVITCVACHNQAAATLDTVTFPSGVEVTGLGPEARCMVCHQGRASTVQVNATLEEGGIEDLDVPVSDLRFVNIHYYAAAATLYGSDVSGGFEYEGQAYNPKFEHVESFDSCVECHSSHTLQVQVDACSACHEGVAAVEDLRNVRMQGSLVDYDGDGNIEEGIFYEIETLQELLLTSIQAYGQEVAGAPIVYSDANHPYWFLDTNENGEIDDDEAVSDNAYNAFTGNLLKAAYNYQASTKDPGMYAHNAKYIIELLYDSIMVVNEALDEPVVQIAGLAREDPGHFSAIQEAFRHWDEDGMVPADCTRCHTAEGLPFLLETGAVIPRTPSTSLECTTCHTNVQDFTLYEVAEVTFPSGAVLGFEDLASNVCLQCHQGRESTVSINAAIEDAGIGDDAVSEELAFRNPHYFAAGATLFGAQARGAYEYEGQDYAGRFQHVENFDTCAECHTAHALAVRVDQCSACHGAIEDQEGLREIRLSPNGENVDYDGDGDAGEGIYFEVETMHQALLAAIQAYAQQNPDAAPITFSAAAYPYWFIDTNENGEADPDEANFGNQYVTWSPEMLRAAYNYTWVAKDPGAFAHNNEYVIQFLYDSIDAIGGDVSGMTRPAASAGESE